MTAEPISFLDKLKMRMAQNQGSFLGSGTGGLPSADKKPERIREAVRTNRWDKKMWTEARKTKGVSDLVEDLAYGDEHKGGERKEFEPAPELSEALFHTFYKANPQLTPKRMLDRDLYPVRKILEEVVENPKLKELQEFTVGDGITSSVALEAMGDTLREILSRVPPPPPPPQPKPKKDKQQQKQPGGQPGQGDPNQGDDPLDGDPQGDPGGHPGPGQQGQGDGDDGQDPNDQNGQPQGGRGQGQGDTDDVDPGTEDYNDEDLTDGEGDPDDGDEGEDDDWDEESAEAEWEAAYDEMLEDLDLDRIANKMLDDAEREASELDNLRKGIGLEDGEWQSMNPEKRLKFAERLRTPEMKALAEIVGQMKRFALGVKATRVIDVPHEAYDVEQGNDIRRVLRAQYALLGHEDTKYEFYRRYSEKELLQFKMRGKEEVGKGPIVVCIDKSYSMAGKPFMWAMGVSEALRRFAADDDRDYFAMFFGTDNDRTHFEFPKGTGPFEKVLSFLGTQANGGTQFQGVLTEALERATKQFDTDGKGKADIVFITDGQAHLTDEWIANFNAERNRAGIRVYSVYIGGAGDMTYQQGPVGLLNKVSDVVLPVSDLKPSAVKDIFERV